MSWIVDGEPVSPAEAFRAVVKDINYQIRAHQDKIRELNARIEELREVAGMLETAATRYERYETKVGMNKEDPV